MSNPFTLTAADGCTIYGYLSKAEKPDSKLVVISHGLTGSPDELLHVHAASALNKAGYDVVRFYFYCRKDNARALKDCTLETHAADLSAVVAHFSGGYDGLYLAGHSYGGITMLVAAIPARAYCFWDSTYVPTWWRDAVPFEDGVKPRWGGDWTIGHAMVDEAKLIDAAAVDRMAGAITAPAQVVLAGAETSLPKREKLFESIRSEKEMVVIDGADHVFSGGKAHELAAHAVRWFGKY
jgi:pimeloyl-ACP methyl ester carboxylesterase